MTSHVRPFGFVTAVSCTMKRDKRPRAAPVLSDSVQRRLVEELFNQKAPLIVSGIVLPTVGIVGFCRTGQLWFAVWAGVAVAIVLGRIRVERGFQRHIGPSGADAQWRSRFLIGALASGTSCGIAAAGAVLRADIFTQMLVISMLTAFVMGAAARNAVYPKAAIGYVLCSEVPLFVACLLTRDVYYVLYCAFIALYCVTASLVIQHLYDQTVRFLCADEQNTGLMNEIRCSNLELETANRQLAEMATTDAMTGVANRRMFDETFDREMRRAQRERYELSLFMFDIDSFKLYNDRYGHQAGDHCLRRVAQALKNTLRRPGDLVARYGGEEFVAILPRTDATGAATVSEMMRVAVESLAIEHTDSTAGIVTVSIGVATLGIGSSAGAAELLHHADEALYKAKHDGRNRVCVASLDGDAGGLALNAAQEIAV